MIFDDINTPSVSDAPARRRRSSARRGDIPSRRHPHSRKDSRRASVGEIRDNRSDHSTLAWLVVLGLLVALALGSTVFLHRQKNSAVTLPGEAPSPQLAEMIEPILAPLATGPVDYETTLTKLSSEWQKTRASVSLEDKEIYTTADTLTGILQEAAADRARHLQRSESLESSANPTMTETARRHHELAIDISWQRNTSIFRLRVEELILRLQSLERGRFRAASISSEKTPSPQSEAL